MQSRRRLGRDISWLAAGYIGRTLAYLGLTALLARSLGPAGYGELSIFLAISAGIGYLAGAWPFLAVPILVGQGQRTGPAFRAALNVALLNALALTPVMVLIGWLLLPDAGVSIALILLYATALIALQGLYSVFQTEGRMASIATAQSLERLTALAVIGGLAVAVPLSLRDAELGLTLSALLVAGAGLWKASRRTPLFDRSQDRVGLRAVTRAVGWMAVITAGGYVIAWVDLVLLAAFRPGEAVGIYALAYQVFTVVLQLGSLWIVVALPGHARDAAEGRATTAFLPVRELTGATFLWAAGVALGAIAASAFLTPIFGSSFRPSLGPLMLLLGSAAVLAPYFAAVAVLVATRRGRDLARVTALGVSINLVLDLVLIPLLGAWGPAIATAAQNVAVTAAVLALVAPSLTLRLLAGVGPVLASVVLLAAAPREPALFIPVAAAAALCVVRGVRVLGPSSFRVRTLGTRP